MSDKVLGEFQQAKEVEKIDTGRKIRIGFIGTGGIAGTHLANYLKMPDVEVVCGCDIVPGKAEAFFKKYKVEGARSYTDHREMLDKEELDGVFVSIGRKPASELFCGQLEIDEYGYIIADESTRTNIAGVFAAGDVRTKALRQVVTAAADGAVAAHFAEEFLTGTE